MAKTVHVSGGNQWPVLWWARTSDYARRVRFPLVLACLFVAIPSMTALCSGITSVALSPAVDPVAVVVADATASQGAQLSVSNSADSETTSGDVLSWITATLIAVSIGLMAACIYLFKRLREAEQMPAAASAGNAKLSIAEHERVLREYENVRDMFSTVVDQLPVIVAIKEIDGRFSFVNQLFLEWYSDRKYDLVGKTSYDIHAGPVADQMTEMDRQAAETKTNVYREMKLTFADGSIRDVDCIKFPIFSRAGDLLAIGTVQTDITERKQTLEHLNTALVDAERANQAKSEFLETMSHEFRTPLNGILGFSEIMREQYFGPLGSETYKGYIENIHDSGEQMLAMVDKVLSITAIRSGRYPLNPQPLLLNEIIPEVVRDVAARADGLGISLSIDVADTLPALFADRESVTYILRQLLGNAITFSHREDSVLVSAVANNGDMILQVIDTGIGIDRDNLAHVTEPFSQLNNDPYIATAGTGLGLAIVKALVEAHRGTLTIESALNQGTNVVIVMPIGRQDAVISDSAQA